MSDKLNGSIDMNKLITNDDTLEKRLSSLIDKLEKLEQVADELDGQNIDIKLSTVVDEEQTKKSARKAQNIAQKEIDKNPIKTTIQAEPEVKLSKGFNVAKHGKSKGAGVLGEQIKDAYKSVINGNKGAEKRLVEYFSAALEKESKHAKFNLEKQGFEHNKELYKEISQYYNEIIKKDIKLEQVAKLAAKAMREQLEVEKKLHSTSTTSQPKIGKNNLVLTDGSPLNEQEMAAFEKYTSMMKKKLGENYREAQNVKAALELISNIKFGNVEQLMDRFHASNTASSTVLKMLTGMEVNNQENRDLALRSINETAYDEIIARQKADAEKAKAEMANQKTEFQQKWDDLVKVMLGGDAFEGYDSKEKGKILKELSEMGDSAEDVIHKINKKWLSGELEGKTFKNKYMQSYLDYLNENKKYYDELKDTKAGDLDVSSLFEFEGTKHLSEEDAKALRDKASAYDELISKAKEYYKIKTSQSPDKSSVSLGDQNGILLDDDNTVTTLVEEEKTLEEVIVSYKELLNLKYKIKDIDKSSYSGKYNSDWIGIYSSQEEAIATELANKKNDLHSSLNLILSEDKNALDALSQAANRLKSSLQPVQDMVDRISSNSSIAYLDEDKGSENWYKSYAEAYKAIDDRLGELSRQYQLTNEELEEYITLQVKAEKIMDKMMDHNGGVKGSGAKDIHELKTWIEKSFARDLGLDPDDIFRGLFGNITNALYGGKDISLFDEEGTKRNLREISAEILEYKGAISGISGGYGAEEDARNLREINTILNYIKKNADEINTTDFSEDIKKAKESVDYYSKKLSEGENTDFYSRELEYAKNRLQELISLQERLNKARGIDQSGVLSPKNTTAPIEEEIEFLEIVDEKEKSVEEHFKTLTDAMKAFNSEGKSLFEELDEKGFGFWSDPTSFDLLEKYNLSLTDLNDALIQLGFVADDDNLTNLFKIPTLGGRHSEGAIGSLYSLFLRGNENEYEDFDAAKIRQKRVAQAKEQGAKIANIVGLLEYDSNSYDKGYFELQETLQGIDVTEAEFWLATAEQFKQYVNTLKILQQNNLGTDLGTGNLINALYDQSSGFSQIDLSINTHDNEYGVNSSKPIDILDSLALNAPEKIQPLVRQLFISILENAEEQEIENIRSRIQADIKNLSDQKVFSAKTFLVGKEKKNASEDELKWCDEYNKKYEEKLQKTDDVTRNSFDVITRDLEYGLIGIEEAFKRYDALLGLQPNQTEVLSGTKEVLQAEELTEQLEDGRIRNLSDIGLSYDEITQKIKRENEEIEKDNRAFKERLTYLKDGKVVESIIGEVGRVKGDPYNHIDADKILHTHPSGDASGSFFSDSDLMNTYSEVIGSAWKEGIRVFELQFEDQITRINYKDMTSESIDDFITQYQSLFNALRVHFMEEFRQAGATPELNEKTSAYVNNIASTLMSQFGGELTTSKKIDIQEDELQSILGLTKQIADVQTEIDNMWVSENEKAQIFARRMEEIVSNYSFTPQVNQTPLSLHEESSGQLALFEGVEEQQKEVEASVEKTNDAIEGQINLIDYLNEHTAKNQPISPTPEPSKAGEKAKETAEEIEKADEIIEESDEEVVEAEEKVAQVTVESREKASDAAKNHAKETKQASEEVLAVLKQLEEAQKRVYSDEDFKNRDIVSQNGSKEIHKEIGEDGELHDVGSFSFLERLQDDQLQRVLVTYSEVTEEWYEQAMSLSTAFEKVGNEIISIDNKIKQYEMARDKTKAAHPDYDTSADEELIRLAKKRQDTLLYTLKIYHDEEEYAYKMDEFAKRRAENTKRLNALEQKNANILQAKADEKATKETEKRAKAIADANTELSKYESRLHKIEMSYSKDINPDLKTPVTITEDLDELENKKKKIQEIIDSLKNAPKDSSKYDELKKLIDDYEISAKYKVQANNPTSGELSGRNLETQVVRMANKYKVLIGKAEKYGDATSENVARLKEQLAILEKVDDTGKRTATSKEYNLAKDVYAEESSYIDVVRSGAREIDGTAKSYDNLIDKIQDYYTLLKKKIKLEAKGEELNPEEKGDFEKLENELKEAISWQDDYTDVTNDSTKAQEKFNQKLKEYQDTLVKNTSAKLDLDLNKYSDKDGKVKEYGEELNRIHKLIEELKNTPIKFMDTASVEKFKDSVQEIKESIANLKNKKFEAVSKDELNDLYRQASKIYYSNTAAPKELRENVMNVIRDIERMKDELNEVNRIEFDKVKSNLKEFAAQIEATGKTGVSLGDKIKSKFKDVAAYYASFVSIQDGIQIFRQGFETIKEYDTALTEMVKVSDEGTQVLKDFQKESFNLANSIGTTANAIQSSAADFMRLGDTLAEAEKHAMDANTLFQVSEFDNITEATSALAAMNQAWKDIDSSHINDVVNILGNNMPIATDELAASLQRSAGTLATLGATIEEVAALTVAGNAILQDPESVAAGKILPEHMVTYGRFI